MNALRGYFFRPTERFFSRRSDVLHLRQRSAASGFLAPHLRHTLKNNLLLCAICFFITSAMGKRDLLLLNLAGLDSARYLCLALAAETTSFLANSQRHR
jgi:hypothetical protein